MNQNNKIRIKVFCIFILAILYSSLSFARYDTVLEEGSPMQQVSKFDRSKLYYGGYVNMSFGTYTVIGVAPMVGYKLTPKLSLGSQITYEYSSYRESSGSNYGFSIFSRYRVIPAFYLHAEYAGLNYKIYNAVYESQRKWVPFLFLGGGISQPISRNTWFTAQVLFDVLNNKNSPYKSFEPFFSLGIGVGF